jgi:hypothetical protein
VLVVIDVASAERVREIAVPEVGEISNPAWSPDGRTIVFSGITAGFSDLYSVDLGSGNTTRLTNDQFADLQPAFSPDGRQLAFVTDRFGTDFGTLSYGAYEIATFDIASAKVKRIDGMMGAHNLNPQWSREGDALYFISTRSGIPNVYRMTVASGDVKQVTNLFSGVSGISDMSPAFTLARQEDRLVFTAFEDRGWNIYSINGATQLAGVPLTPEVDGEASLAGGLPPLPRPTESAFNRVANYLADNSTGLPSHEEALAYTSNNYRPRLGLDYLGQPTVGISTGGMFGGVGLYGGISGIFSDVLGGHTVGGAVEAQGQWDEIGFQVQYLRSLGRWSYGLAAQRIPYIYGYYAGTGGVAQQVVRERIFDTGVNAYARYPVSTVQRVDFGVGLRRISQDQQIQSVQYNPRTGTYASGDRRSVDGPGYNMVESTAAWVYDSSLSGYTAPIAGQRARVEIAPTFGQIQYFTALADLRRYVNLEPFTLAFRALTYGRYGRDSEGIFSDLYLGSSALVRGYDNAYGDCVTYNTGCTVLNQMIGSRLAVGNAELRVPIIKPSSGGFSLPPVDAHIFYDAGVSWTASTSPVLRTGIPTSTTERGLLTSAGVGGRMNLFGFAVLEVDYVRAMALGEGWRWVFALQPGF